ncbi:hypothetical protein J7L67_08005, partial [bacterium]|nr:hypothetical protein [bacterium]
MDDFLFKPYKKIFKIISVILIESLVFSSILWANSEGKISAKLFTLPEKIGTVRDRHDGTASKKFVIHIQDTHTSYSAQKYMAKILDHLNSKYNAELIGIEGASLPIDVSKFSSFPDTKSKNIVSDYFLKTGRIDGVEYYCITEDSEANGKKYEVEGIESEQLYRSNLNAYVQSIAYQDEIRNFCKVYRKNIGLLKKQVYSEQLLVFDDLISSYNKRHIAFADFCLSLLRFCENDLIEYEDFEYVNNLFKMVKLESLINFNVLDVERVRAINMLSKELLSKQEAIELLNKEIAFRTQKVSPQDFYIYLESLFVKNNFSLDRFKNLAKYISYLKTFRNINHDRILKQVQVFIDSVYANLIQTDQQLTVHEISNLFNLISKFPELQITRAEIQKYHEYRSKYPFAFICDYVAKKSREFDCGFEQVSDLSRVEEGLSLYEDFYKFAYEREDALVSNTIDLMDKENKDKIVLVAGGFHTSGITEMLKRRNISYVVITPRMDSDYQSIAYKELLQNHYSPLDEMLVASVSTLKMASWLTAGAPLVYPERAQFLSDKLRLLLTTTAMHSQWIALRSQYSKDEQKAFNMMLEKQVLDAVSAIIDRTEYSDLLTLKSVNIDADSSTITANIVLRGLSDSIQVSLSDKGVSLPVPADIQDNILEVIRLSNGVTTRIYTPNGHNILAEQYALVRNMIFDNIFESQKTVSQILRDVQNRLPEINITEHQLKGIIANFIDMGFIEKTSDNQFVVSQDTEKRTVSFLVKNLLMKSDDSSERAFTIHKMKADDFSGEFQNSLNSLDIDTIIFEPTISLAVIDQFVTSVLNGNYSGLIKPGAEISLSGNSLISVTRSLGTGRYALRVYTKPDVLDEETTIAENIRIAFNLSEMNSSSQKNVGFMALQILKQIIGVNINAVDMDYAVLLLSSQLTAQEKTALINYLLNVVSLGDKEHKRVEQAFRAILKLPVDYAPLFSSNVARLIIGNSYGVQYKFALALLAKINPQLEVTDDLSSRINESLISLYSFKTGFSDDGYKKWTDFIRSIIMDSPEPVRQSKFSRNILALLNNVYDARTDTILSFSDIQILVNRMAIALELNMNNFDFALPVLSNAQDRRAFISEAMSAGNSLLFKSRDNGLSVGLIPVSPI